MSYLVLARKYRPQKFSEVIGQQHVTKALVNTILKDKVPHALLLTGPRGVGKTTSARIFARSLNCTKLKKGEPCGACTSCEEINKGSSLAVWEIDGASNNSVDNIRELTDSLRTLPPPGSKYKIYIIDEVHMLSTAAFNALLKSLEEPPPNTVFIFATTDPQKIPDTVLSRCQRYDFTRLKDSLIIESLTDILKTEKITFEDGVLEFIARKADGGLRDAQSMLDRVMVFADKKLKLEEVLNLFGAVDRQFFFDLAHAIKNKDTKLCLDLIDNTFLKSLDIKDFVSEFICFWREALVAKFSRNEADGKVKELIQDISGFDMQRLFDLAEDTTNRALRSSHPKFTLEAGIIRMATIMDLQPIVSLLNGSNLSNVSSVTTPTAQTMRKEAPSVSIQSSQVKTEEKKTEKLTEKLDETKQPLQKEEHELVEDVAVPNNFNPSWEALLSDLNKQGLVRLLTYLKRVAPAEFKLGKLTLKATNFDMESLKDKELFEQLESSLCRYSGEQRWDIKFEEVKDATSVPNSEHTKERVKKEAKREVIKNKAIKGQALKDVLSVFEGSKVQKVSILE